MIPRNAASLLSVYASEFPVVAVTGPRQSGKTTLVRTVFSAKPYASLEDIDQYRFAQEDPRGFLGQFPDGAILDEVQKCPDIFSYLQGVVDEVDRTGLFVLTGSSQFQLNRAISQSLAGRVGNMTLLPFSIAEMREANGYDFSIDEALFHGFYPRILAKKADPRRWLNAYIETYVEKDVRQLLEIKNRDAFMQFVSLCAGNVGSLLNLNRLATDCSVSMPTAKSWLSVLQASYICFTLQPHSNNFRKRVVKTPKLYFYDVGLAARLIGVTEPGQLRVHPLKGSLFENMVIADILKQRLHRGLEKNMYFWRDNTGMEIDLILEEGQRLSPMEIKSGMTVNSEWFKSLKKWLSIASGSAGSPALCYGGDWEGTRSGITIVNWKNTPYA